MLISDRVSDKNCSFENMKQLYIKPLFESFIDIYIHEEVYKELDDEARLFVDTYIGKNVTIVNEGNLYGTDPQYIVNRDYASRGLDPNINYVLLQNNGSGLPYITPAELYPSEEADQAYRKLATDVVHDLVLKEYISEIKNVSPEAVEERTFIETDLFNLIGSFTATSVINGITDASWVKYLADLKAYQYYEWIDWWQKYVDGEL